MRPKVGERNPKALAGDFISNSFSQDALSFFLSFPFSLFLHSKVEDLKIGLQQPVAFIST